ncbi:DUF3943 domain-containing protein [Helicobacter sp. MIT 05-5293]|uniref:DUF3943 domain-containing protein n=1 Tax=Helicobacter sp. MIT 05-5293 TaxID=1548149 RepID=UPI0009DD492A|nr:DUF3943 domain-containing protein [Helicobacter sp. MIT 05-5293]TLD82219.1 DUF3943 domain-containing protein [Helicobacter sp. MIT 05-5293]
MKFLRIIVIALFISSLQANTDSDIDYKNLAPIQTKPTLDSPTSINNPYIYEPTHRGRYVLTSTGVIVLGTIAGAGILYLMPESATNWNKDDIVNLGKQWRKNVSRAPVVDADDWFLNWITHPYWGAVYYMQTRVAGYSWSESVLYSAFASAFFWEFGIEAFAEIPSWQDLVITPAIGSIFGELFFRATRHIQANQNRLLGSKILGKTSLILMDPIGMVMQDFGLAKLVGISNKNQTQSFMIPISDTRGGVGVRLVLAMQW